LCNLALALFALPTASLYAQVPFYQGKTITVIVSSDAGGTSDLRVKSLVPYLQKYIPGNPTVVVDYMPGGGGRKAANHVFRSVKPDGLMIGSMGTTLLAAAIQGESGVLYDLNKFIYLGSSDAATQHIFSTRKEVGLTSLEKLRGAPGIRIGAQSVGHNIYITGRLFAYFLALKDPRMVVGYSGPEVDLALLRGEVDARSSLIASIVQRTPEWVDKGLVDFHAVKRPKAIAIRVSRIFLSSRLLPNRIRNGKCWSCSAPFASAAQPLFSRQIRRASELRSYRSRCAKHLMTLHSRQIFGNSSAKIPRRSCPTNFKKSSRTFPAIPK
jgi:hypothetical protein